MNIGRVLKYLITGVIVGAVLFFAGFGVVNLLKKDPVAPPVVQQPVITPDTTVTDTTSKDTGAVEVVAPSINVAEGTKNSPIKIKPLGATDSEAADGEASTEEPAPAFGTLTLKAINSNSQQPLKADFLIQNDAGAAIAQVKSTASTTLSFPVGSYKITVNQGTNKIVRYLGVKDGQNGSETFEIDAPTLTDEPVADTSVANAPVIVETPSAPVTAPAPAVSTEVDSSSDTDTATSVTEVAAVATAAATSAVVANVSSSTNTDSSSSTTASTETAATQPATTTTSNNDADKGIGGLRVSALTKVGNRPMEASFYIQRLNGENVANVKNVKTHQFNLPAGSYRITARTGTTRMVKQIKVVAARGLHEIFNIPTVADSTTTAPASTAQAPTVSAPVAVAPAVTAPKPAEPTPVKAVGRLELFSRDAASNKPVRANFYVHTPTGKLITSKTYVESIGYKLPTAAYKVTVRATGYKDKTITLNVRKDQTRRETFKMELIAAPAPAPATPVSTVAPAVPQQAVRQGFPSTRGNRRGGLQVNVVSAQGVPLKADVFVLRRNGTPVKRAINASTANFDLPPRNFVVRVRHGGFVTNQQITVKPDKLAIKTITFDLTTGFRQ